ncbi:MAG: hypothetical protein K2N64_01275 [Anaeroplasmataceae bacterium]|nr:hypothetical protein [Anaeroplasmataceae bacterium]
MKKTFLIVVFVVSVLFGLNTLTGCKESETLSDKEKTQIIASFKNTYGKDYGTVDIYYGKHKGYIVFEMMSMLPAEKIVQIGEEIFVFTSRNDLWTFKDDKLVLLEKVYDRGDLTDKDIAKIHSRYLQEIKKANLYENYLKKVEVYKNRTETHETDHLKTYWSGSDTKVINQVWEKVKSGVCPIDYELGKYNYSFVFMQVGTQEGAKTITVAEQEYTYSKDFTIWVYKDRDIILKEEIITLEEAYQRGYLTKDNIKAIHDIFISL